jgi:hypothetical protein
MFERSLHARQDVPCLKPWRLYSEVQYLIVVWHCRRREVM